nr:CoB--CoM heterodisulfide reductase iron-sulfur subunit A family protein [Desulfobacterales bacterium]
METKGNLGTGNKIGAIAVIGGGISGIQASLDAANSGFKVFLIESNTSIGGVMAQLDKTFPTNDCSTCMISPKLIEVAKHPNIEIISYADVLDISGPPGNFSVKIKKKARYVDENKCVGCGICASKCPKKVPDAFNRGLGKRKAIYVSFPQAVPLIYTIDKENCIYFKNGRCRACEKFCENNAIDFAQQDEIIEIGAGTIILAPGFETFDASIRGEYGYGRYPNVITSIEYERILSAGGPSQGHIQRPSDSQVPKRIAWIQCVGSRDASMGRGYCSYVCCMYAIKQAVISKEHDREIDTCIFYIDIRAQGKGFDRYFERARSESGVRFVRSMISRVVENPISHNLEINYIDESGEIRTEEFDMVILSVGLSPNQAFQDLARKLEVELNQFGFCESRGLELVSTSRPGFFVCGVFQSPKDIPETVLQGSSAAAEAMGFLADVRGTMVAEEVYPEERDVRGEEPRIGVFVCHCGINIAGVVDVKAVSEFAKTLSHVVFADNYLFACSTDTQEEMKKIIKEHKLNRVVVASCSPRTHEPLFQDTLREAGLNKYLFEMANIRDQNSWVHANEKENATEKAKDLVRMSVARAALLEPLHEVPFNVVQKGLVVGGGLAGLTAALTLAEQGYETYLIERSADLGGNARTLYYTEEGARPSEYLKDLVQKVKDNRFIRVYTNAEVIDCSGHVGRFTSTISVNGKKEEISYGVAIVATGGEEYKPKEYLYGENNKVLTQRELEERLASCDEGLKNIKDLVMIQCVGSRDDEHPYCSRVCCTEAVKNALKLKELNPKVNIYVLYRDIRTFGFKEFYYKKARENGVRFIRYEADKKPQVREVDGILQIVVYDPNLRSDIELKADILTLSAAIRPHSDSKSLATVFKLPCDQDGFFLEAHLKLRPLDFTNAGFFLCGLAHGPKFADESVAQAKGAASRACTILSKAQMYVGGAVAQVDGSRCVACLTCVRTCPYNVPRLDEEEGVIYIDTAACQGCGNCATACPRGAVVVAHNTDEQFLAKITALY